MIVKIHRPTIGVPVSFLDRYNPDQFEIIGIDSTDFAESIGIKPMGDKFIDNYRKNGGTGHYTAGMRNLCYYDNKGKPKKVYSRILIKHKKKKDNKNEDTESRN